jgi:glycosyltransferase involved in cell wall biosynthesis
MNFLGVIVSRWLKIPLILEYNGSEVWAYKMWGEQYWLQFNWLAEIIESVNVQAAVCVVVVSDALREELLRAGVKPSKIVVEPNGVDVTFYDASLLERERNQKRKLLSIHNKFVFGFIGTFSYWHGIEILEYMIPRVLALVPHAHFLLIGEGVLHNSLKNKLKTQGISSEHVTFTGRISQCQAREYLAACDSFLCPTQPNADGSRFFGSPIKLFEYLSMAKPVIASSLEQLKEVIYPAVVLDEFDLLSRNSNAVGVLVDPQDEEAFVRAAVWVAQLNESLRSQMGTRARQRVIDRFTWTARASNIKRYFEGEL